MSSEFIPKPRSTFMHKKESPMIIVDAFGPSSRTRTRRKSQTHRPSEDNIHVFLTFGGRRLSNEQFEEISRRVADVVEETLQEAKNVR